ncbi:MAG: thioredoxin domain-containing protein [Bacteroidota bacterium]
MADPLPEITEADHAQGPADARVTILQYGDFECPWALQVHQIATEMREAFPDDLRFVFRHFPLRYHPHALIAALASEAVAREHGEGAFWTYHDHLYANQAALRRDLLPQHAETLGFDREAVHIAVEEATGKTEILAQKRGGVRAGVRSTLALFIDGELFQDDAVEDAVIERVIQPLKAAG